MALRSRLTSTALSQSAASIPSPNAWYGAATLQTMQRFSGRSPIVYNPLVVPTVMNVPTQRTDSLTRRASAATRTRSVSALQAVTSGIVTPNQNITGQTSNISSTVESTRRNLTARITDATSKARSLVLSAMRRQ